MILNGSDRIKESEGDYIVLVDYGSDGLSVRYQAETCEEALRWMLANDGPQTLVKLVRVREI